MQQATALTNRTGSNVNVACSGNQTAQVLLAHIALADHIVNMLCLECHATGLLLFFMLRQQTQAQRHADIDMLWGSDMD